MRLKGESSRPKGVLKPGITTNHLDGEGVGIAHERPQLPKVFHGRKSRKLTKRAKGASVVDQN